MARNRHDCAGSIADEDVVCDPDRDLFLVHRVDGESAGENAGLFLGQFRPFEVGFGGDFFLVFANSGQLRFGCHPIDQRMLRGKYHVGRSEERVWTGSKNRDQIVDPIHAERDRGTFTAANPISLQSLYRLLQSSPSSSSNNRSAYAVIRNIHWRIGRRTTGNPPTSLLPSTTSSFARTVPSSGHQFTGASVTYASRLLSANSRRSSSDSCGNSRLLRSRSSSIGRAAFSFGSNQELYNFKKIHCVHL